MEKLVDEAEKSLDELVRNNTDFFESMKSPECIKAQSDAIKKNLFGNTTKSFAALSAMLSIKDPRLELISEYFSKQEINIFHDKRILDIGCHNGQMALQIGALYNPKLIIGIDIDTKLVR